jgi:hypothetical protein
MGVSRPRLGCALPTLTAVAQVPQHPRAEPAWWLAQLCFLGLGLVLVAKPNPSWTDLPLPSHGFQRIQARQLTSVLVDGGVLASVGRLRNEVECVTFGISYLEISPPRLIGW